VHYAATALLNSGVALGDSQYHHAVAGGF